MNDNKEQEASADEEQRGQTDAVEKPGLKNGGTEMECIDPPRSSGERFRDKLEEIMEGRFFSFLNAFVLFLVIGDGAAFFFLLMGWQTMCHPRHDCPQRNRGYNITVQILTGLFTYMAAVALPWRCTNFLHLTGLSCPFRNFQAGRNWYGQPTDRIWFHIPRAPRFGITLCMMLSALTQCANQTTRIIYPTYEKQNVSPGNIWTNVFFASSFGFAGMGAAWLELESSRLRRSIPNHPFGPGPLALIKICWVAVLRKLPWCCGGAA
jgi:hypothetical protein